MIGLGIYRHYKGPLYQVIGVAHDANADTLTDMHRCAEGIQYSSLDTRIVVVYIPLQLDGAHFGPRMAVRTLDDFCAMVCGSPEHPDYGTTQCNHFEFHEVQRFTYLGLDYGPEMVPGA